MKDALQLKDLVSVGEATLADLKRLGIESIEDLKQRDPVEMYETLCRLTGAPHDICCLDVFTAAVEQAKDPHLPTNKRNWWYWSQVRKEAAKSSSPINS
jgi:Pathogenicity locus